MRISTFEIGGCGGADRLHISSLNCRCIEVLKDKALKMAAEADEKIAAGGARRPLEGVPILVKGNIDVAGTLSTAAMPGLKDWRPEKTAPVVAKLMEAGAIPIAKTTLPEAAVRASGLNARAHCPVPVAGIHLHVGSSPSEGSPHLRVHI
jgi:Asp-tRNA(Asn)/Glu-tRNA(Gln) amidotransferase A subunit family amidase